MKSFLCKQSELIRAQKKGQWWELPEVDNPYELGRWKHEVGGLNCIVVAYRSDKYPQWAKIIVQGVEQHEAQDILLEIEETIRGADNGTEAE